jgi:tetratricopeptide (TPR) repeat protein
MKIDTSVVKRDSIDIYGNKVKDQFGQVISITDTVINNPKDSLLQKKNLLKSVQTPDFENRVKELMGGKVPPLRPNLPADSLKSIILKDRFEIGNLFFTELNIPDSAYKYYTEILQSEPNPDYTARTLYALGSYYLTKNDSVKADSLFLVIYDNYKYMSIVNAAANKLGKDIIDLKYDPAKDIYASAEKEMLDNQYDSSLAKLRFIYDQYPSSPLAPKALYASGWILENQLDKPDSAARLYDSLTVKYPSTVYAGKIKQKISIYNQEQLRLAKAREDSLKKIEMQKPDSLSRVDSLGQKSQQIDSVKSLKNVPPNKFGEPDINKVRPGVDSLRNRLPGIDSLRNRMPGNDSLRRREDQSIEELQRKSENQADSLNPGDIKHQR